MKKYSKEDKKVRNNRGITLIALAITIIVLLILVGVAIVTLTEDNGLLIKAQAAKDANIKSTAKEKIQIEIAGSFNLIGKIDIELLNTNLARIDGLTYNGNALSSINKITALPVKVRLEGYDFTIKADGTITVKDPNVIEAADVQSDPATYYGKYVTYTSSFDAGINASEGQKWQIFMADDDNIYLIASNYITKQYTGKKNNVGFDYDINNYTESTATKMWFTNIINQYSANGTTTDIPYLLSKFNTKTRTTYHKWMNTEANQTKNYYNEKAVASMLDVDLWNGYKNNTYAEYAIGGPTLEMFCKSYNDSREDDTDLLEAKENNNYGYKINKKSEPEDIYATNLKTGAKNTLVNNMYFRFSTYYWFATPSAMDYYSLMYVSYSGYITSNGHETSNICFRPLVCLKSDVYLLLDNNAENTYTINI